MLCVLHRFTQNLCRVDSDGPGQDDEIGRGDGCARLQLLLQRPHRHSGALSDYLLSQSLLVVRPGQNI